MSDDFLLKQHASEFDSVEELISFAQTYYSTDFRTPAGVNCEHLADLEKVTAEGRLPPDELRQHLLTCSNCFRRYRNLIAARDEHTVQVQPQASSSIWGFVRRPRVLVPVSVLSAIVLIVAIHSVRRSGSPDYVATNGTTVQTQVEPASPRPGSSVRIDFNTYGLHRGATSNEHLDAIVSTTRAQFFVILPSGSPAGKYLVSLTDANVRPLKNLTAESGDGKALTAEMDLTGLPPKKYWLCVSRPAASPDCYASRA